jgi:DNA-directed RNA polymerase subunit K
MVIDIKDKVEVKEFTKYEKARMIGSRALQISMGAPFLVKMTDEDLKKIKYNPVEIAKMEFSEGAIPITIKRPLPKPKVA